MDTQPSTNLNDVIHDTSREFAAFFKISSETQGESIAENIEGVLVRLDELYGMLDMIRSDNTLATDELLPIVREDLSRLQPVFEQIDRLDEFVQMIKRNVMEVEKEVKLAEKDFSALSSIKKVVTGLQLFSFKKKNVTSRAPPKPAYIPPRIFSTAQFVRKEETTQNEEEKSETNVEETSNTNNENDSTTHDSVATAEES